MLMLFQFAPRLALGHVPKLDRAVVSGGRHDLPVRGEGDGPDRARMPVERQLELPIGRIPNLHIARPIRQPLPADARQRPIERRNATPITQSVNFGIVTGSSAAAAPAPQVIKITPPSDRQRCEVIDSPFPKFANKVIDSSPWIVGL